MAHLDFTLTKTIQVTPSSPSAGAWAITTITTVILTWNMGLVGPACTEKSTEVGLVVTVATCHNSRDYVFIV